MRIKIEKASIKDYPFIIFLQKNDGFEHAYYLTRERFKRLLKRGEVFYIASVKDKKVGFISGDFEIRARIHFFSVLKKLQGKGIGTALLEKILNEAKKRNFKKVYIIIESSAKKMAHFLRKRGFKKVGYHKNRFGDGRNGIFLEKKL